MIKPQEPSPPQASQRVADAARAFDELASALEAFSRTARERMNQALDRFGETVESLTRRARKEEKPHP